MSLNSVITAVDLQETFIDKNTGLPLAGGQLRFWVDGARTTPKVVYQITGNPTDSQGDGYSFAPLPNPLVLSDVGTIVDNNGNNVPVYYYPYDADDNLELYYIEIYGADGVMQATRQAWPNNAEGSGGGGGGSTTSVTENQITNSQFVETYLGDTDSATFSYTGSATTTYSIAPGWTIEIDHTGSDSLTIQRTAVVGSTALQTNPPYLLVVTPGLNISGLRLSQRFDHNPALLAETAQTNSGWIATGLALGAGNSVTVDYVPSNGTPTTGILSATNSTISLVYFTNTVKLPQSTNSDDAATGYVDIKINLSPTAATTLSSVQLTAASPSQTVGYIQDSVARQTDHLFHLYREALDTKPIPSFLTGWDFSLNPTQCQPKDGTPTFGAKGSGYIWDQTILYTQTSGSVNYQPADMTTLNGPLKLLMTATDNIAIVQYLPLEQARALLSQPVSVMVSAHTDNATAIPATVTLWYTDGTNVPDLNSNLSIVDVVDNDGTLSALNQPTGGVWTELTRSQGKRATFEIETAIPSVYHNYPFNGWDLNGDPILNSVTYFAIVVTLGQVPSGQYVTFNSVSVVPGEIPTIPAPQTSNQVFFECQQYYWKTYAPAYGEGDGTSNGSMILPAGFILNSALQNYYYPKSFSISFPSTMWKEPDVRFYALDGTPNQILLTLINAGAPENHTIADTAWTITSFRNSINAINNWSVSQSTTSLNYADAVLRFQAAFDARIGLI